MRKNKPVVIFILGPTGAGKSDFAARLAAGIKGEIISCDSMQVYKGMAVISQQPGPKLRSAVRHHLIGALSPSREWSAAGFVKRAEAIAKDIVKRKKVPIVVGGTGLYARAFIKGLFPSPGKDEGLRRRLRGEAGRKGGSALYKRLRKIDPAYASRIHPNDLRRVIRAIEVYELTGRPISQQHKQARGIESRYRTLVFVLTRPRAELYKRIDERVEKMFKDGVVEEVKRLKKKRVSRTARAALGYKEINEYLNGRCSIEEAKELLKKNTRRYAKRQLTWFRREKDTTWLTLGTGKHMTPRLNISKISSIFSR